MILAWIAVIVPATILIVGMAWVMTDGFTDWGGLLWPMGFALAGLIVFGSLCWGIRYLSTDHPKPLPVPPQAERPA